MNLARNTTPDVARLRFAFSGFVLALAPWLGGPAFAAPGTVDPGTESQPAPDPAIESREPEPEPSPATTPDWKGVRRDTGYFLGYQFAAIAVLYTMPKEVTNWDRSGDHLDKWWDNVRNPTWDEDDFYINYILHPYWGATYYIRGRERGLSRWQSLGYSALLSTLYEYGAEALFERPSYQDLIVTPLLGSLLGEFVFTPIRNSIKSKPGPLDGWDKFALVITDPLGAANDLTNRLFGVETQVALTPFRGMNASRPTSGPLATALYAGGRDRGTARPPPPEKPDLGSAAGRALVDRTSPRPAGSRFHFQATKNILTPCEQRIGGVGGGLPWRRRWCCADSGR